MNRKNMLVFAVMIFSIITIFSLCTLSFGASDEIGYLGSVRYKYTDATRELRFSAGELPNPIPKAWDANFKSEVETIVLEGNIITKGTTSKLFDGYIRLETIKNFDKLDTSAVNEMRDMFYGCGKLTDLDVSSWDTSNVTSMYGLFGGCSSLTNIDARGWRTGSLMETTRMFADCTSLDNLNISKWDTSKVTTMEEMFLNCSSLSSMDLSKWDTSSLTRMDGIFKDCSSLTSLDISKWDTSNVTAMRRILNNCSSLTAIDLNDWNISNVYTLEAFFDGCSSLTQLDLNNWDTSNVVAIDDIFDSCTNLTKIDVSDWNTSNILGTQRAFRNCSSLTDLDVSKWDTSNFNGLFLTFYNCSSLESLDVSNWNTSNFANIISAFSHCSSLTEIDVSNWDISNATDIGSLFNVCNSLTQLDVSNWDTSNVTNMSSVFYLCESLEEVDVSNWDTSNVTDMHEMFRGCNSLNNPDVSNWNTSNVTNMRGMFRGCNSLNNLDVSNWNTSNVANMREMFYQCNSLDNLNVSNWNTSNVTDMNSMFYQCTSLSDLDVGNWNTSNVTDMVGMFWSCSGLDMLDLSSFHISNLTNINSMLRRMSQLSKLSLGSNIKTLQGVRLPNIPSMETFDPDIYTGKWKNVGTGTVKFPQGNQVLTSEELMNTYDGSHPDTYVWQPVFEEFEMVRLSGKTRYETAVEVSKEMYNSADNVIIVNGRKYPDALSSTSLAKLYSAPILLVKRNEIPASIKEEIERLGASKAIIVGGKGVVSESVASELEGMGLTIERYSGKDRYKTALAVAEKVVEMTGGGNLVLVKGTDFPDALTVSSLALKEEIPILLTKPNILSTEVKSFIEEQSPSKLYIAGGKGAVSLEIQNSIEDLGISVTRFSGKDRYETGKEIAEYTYPSPNEIIFANGRDFADAMVGGPLTTVNGGPVMLVGKNHVPQATKDYMVPSTIESVYKAYIVGGKGVVSEPVEVELTNMLNE